MKHVCCLVAVMLCALATSAMAQSTEDIVSLHEKGVGEDVLLAAVENSKTGFTLSAADILKLKDAKVPDKVVAAMLRHKGKGGEIAARPAVAAPVPVMKDGVAAADGTLNIENVDDKHWAYMYEPDEQTIWITGEKGEGRGALEAHGGVSLRMKPGTYSVRFEGEEKGQAVKVLAGEKSLILLSRVETAQIEALYVSIFERGERKSGGRIVVLRETPKASNGRAAKQPEREETVVARNADRDYEQPRERVIERERIVEVPSTTVVYRDAYVPAPVYPVYVAPRYCAPHYAPVYCGPRYYSGCGSYYSGHHGYSSFGYSNYGRRSGFSVGVGFGF
jgi:hypothetical protein